MSEAERLAREAIGSIEDARQLALMILDVGEATPFQQAAARQAATFLSTIADAMERAFAASTVVVPFEF
jgi:hypothetical protein